MVCWWFETRRSCDTTEIFGFFLSTGLSANRQIVCCLWCYIALRWRHNGRDGVSNHQRLHSLHNCWCISKNKTSKLRVTVRGINRWPVNSPHKWPVTRKMSPFDDVIMIQFAPCYSHWANSIQGRLGDWQLAISFLLTDSSSHIANALCSHWPLRINIYIHNSSMLTAYCFWYFTGAHFINKDWWDLGMDK